MSAALALLLASFAGAAQEAPPTIDLSTPRPPETAAEIPAVAPPRLLAPQAAAREVGPQPSPRGRSFRSGIGVSQVARSTGVSPSAGFGMELSPWSLIGLRIDANLVYGGSLGELNAVSLDPGVVVKLAPAASRLLPYVGAGVSLSLLTIDPAGPRGNPLPTRSPAALRAARSTHAAIGDTGASPLPGSGGATPAEYMATPRVSAGASIQITRGAALDVGAHYMPVRWQSSIRHAFAETLTLCLGF